MIQVPERADISQSILHLIEHGKTSMAMGTYFNFLRMLGKQDDFLKLMEDHVLERKLQYLELLK
ncbi:hypothetical protein [Flavobacterium dankookense]|nr:hypothetical protein [Flavobacterium dankookense]